MRIWSSVRLSSMIEIIDQLGRKYVISWNMKDWHSSAMPAHRNPPMS
ncbi:hypothetical protein CG666_08990, partial [Bordetella pertussis]